ncbi:MAG TPA: hypothetical protein VK988_04200 [Acidimicrobiales bacterium]|nr:hypothetical protein [Acidimicrobiales bacterium]
MYEAASREVVHQDEDETAERGLSVLTALRLAFLVVLAIALLSLYSANESRGPDASTRLRWATIIGGPVSVALSDLVGNAVSETVAGILLLLATLLLAMLSLYARRSIRCSPSRARQELGERTDIPWLRTFLFAAGLSGLIGAVALGTAAIKTGRADVLIRGVPAIAELLLVLTAAIFLVIIFGFWWQDRKDRE